MPLEVADYGPFTDGFVAAVDRTKIGRNSIGPDSLNCGVDPATGVVYRRKGSQIVGDNYAAMAGLLEGKFGAKGRHLVQFASKSLADGVPTYSCLFTNESTKLGQLYYRSTNGGGYNHVIGDEYGAVHRDNTITSVWNLQMIPLWTESAQTFTRAKNVAARQAMMAGSRRVLEMNGRIYAPNRYGTPMMWNTRFNDTTAAGTEKNRIRPSGPLPVIFPPRRLGATVAATGGIFKGEHIAYYAVVPQFEDGSYGAPFIGGNGLGLIQVGAAATLYSNVQLNIPPGPEGTIRRIVCRTTMVDTSAPYAAPDPYTLKICGVVNNNTASTFYDDTPDSGLSDNAQVIRYDYIMPPRARTLWTMDGRVVYGDLSANPAAIILAPYSANNSYLDTTTYTYDTVGAYSGTRFYFWFDGTNLKLKHGAGGGAAGVDQTIAIAGLTLQGVVDAINTVAVGVGVYNWRAQLAPGVDGDAPASDLQVMNGADWFDDDTAAADGTTGNCRVINGCSLPGFLYFKATSDWLTRSVDENGVHFTISGPGTGTQDADAPMAPNATVGGNQCRRRLRANMRRLLGGGALLDGSIVVYSGGIGLLRNVRGGKTGIDTDYRLEQWKGKSGGISWQSIAEGDGWVTYMTRKGLMVNDGKKEVCVSKRVWITRGKGGAAQGPWAYEVNECIKGLAKGDDSGQFHVAVEGGRIYVSYRSSGAASYPDAVMVYDFTQGMNEVGVDQVLDADGNAFPWSSPYTLSAAAMGEVVKSDGPHLYAVLEESTAGYATGDGAIVEIERAGSNDDPQSPYGVECHLVTDDFGSQREKKRPYRVTLRYKAATGANANVTVYMNHKRTLHDVMPPSGTYLPMDSASSVQYLEARLRVPATLRTPGDTVELVIADSGTSGAFEIHRARVEFERVNTSNP